MRCENITKAVANVNVSQSEHKALILENNKHKICAQLRKIDRGKQIDGNYENLKRSKKILQIQNLKMPQNSSKSFRLPENPLEFLKIIYNPRNSFKIPRNT